MKSILLSTILFTFLINVYCTIDPVELKCLVCEASLSEMVDDVNKLDPERRVDVGSFRLDIDGNLKHKTVSQTKSEIRLSEIADVVCTRMDDYIRATWKSNGTLTLLRLLVDGQLNPDMSAVDIIQDDDLNKSLKYYCEDVIAEYEDSIIEHFQNGADNIPIRVCSLVAHLCNRTLPKGEDKEEL